jgi:NitT/TauT family transport system substrate-binding protein
VAKLEQDTRVALTRRAFIGRLVTVGAAATAVPTLLAACSQQQPAAPAAAPTSAPAAAAPTSAAAAAAPTSAPVAAATAAPAAGGTMRQIKFSHGTGLCNMPLFYSAEKKLFEPYGISSDVVLTPLASDIAIQLSTGQVEMSVIPFTNAIGAYVQEPNFQVVSGSGIHGLIIITKPEIKTWQDLRGKQIGTFQIDTLDIIVYDYLKANGLTYNDVKMVYFGDTVELNNAFISGQLDALSTIEPYATKAQDATKGTRLGDGIDIYGQGYPDCVLAARKELIEKEPEVIKGVIATFFEAEYQIENNFEEAANTTVGKYYKTELESLIKAAQAQPPGIDIRDKKDFMFARAKSMLELNYIKTEPDQNFVNFTFLEQVIKEKPELWNKVKVHAKV